MRPISHISLAFLAFLSFIPNILCLSIPEALSILGLDADFEFAHPFSYGVDKIRGVNLGGWLVIESFTTPSLFDKLTDDRIVDEWTFWQYQDKTTAAAALKQHYETFITETDFQEIAAAGLNHVRIPIGHWMFDVAADEPYGQGQLEYLLRAISWAKKYQLMVIIALYGTPIQFEINSSWQILLFGVTGAPGSQNGFINSGHLRDAPYWHTDQSYVDRTTAIMQTLSDMFGHQTDVVSIIQVMNEPLGTPYPTLVDVLKKYYTDTYNIFRKALAPLTGEFIVMLHDAFEPLSFWDGFMPNAQYKGVMMDSHIYQMFGDHDSHMTYDEHIQAACQNATIMAQSSLPIMIGEWTATNNDCGRHLLGRFVGPEYDGSAPGSTRVGSCDGLTGDASTFSVEYKEFMRKFWEAQTQSYEKGSQGWVMWSWKMENADEWSYKAGLANGWIPQDPTDYKYPNICG